MGLHRHANSTHDASETPETILRNARLGLRFFVVYMLLYLAFVVANAFAPEAMEWIPFAGLNLAILSGLGLILFAIVLAVIACKQGLSVGGDVGSLGSRVTTSVVQGIFMVILLVGYLYAWKKGALQWD